jgi:hypothetical protein
MVANPANLRHFIVITKTECQLGILSGMAAGLNQDSGQIAGLKS